MQLQVAAAEEMKSSAFVTVLVLALLLLALTKKSVQQRGKWVYTYVCNTVNT